VRPVGASAYRALRGNKHEVEPNMKKTKADPAPKPDHIRSLRDLAANFVRAIDATSLEFEAVATVDLTERVACLTALHEMPETAEWMKMETKQLRSRLTLFRQVRAMESDFAFYRTRDMTNGELKKRVEYLRLLTVANADVSKVSNETLTDLAEEAKGIVKKREREAAAEARRIVRVVDMGERARALSASHTRFVAPVSDMETCDDVAEEDDESAVA